MEEVMKLIDLLVRELPKRGGWPGAIPTLVQNSAGRVYQAGGGKAIYRLELSDDWMTAEVTCEKYFDALRNLKPEWDGAGLPPAGCEFEYLASQGRWISATMSYCGKAFAIIETDGMETWLRLAGIEVRPVSSEADKKRDEISSQINAAADASGTLGNMIYDAIVAGKIPGVRIE